MSRYCKRPFWAAVLAVIITVCNCFCAYAGDAALDAPASRLSGSAGQSLAPLSLFGVEGVAAGGITGNEPAFGSYNFTIIPEESISLMPLPELNPYTGVLPRRAGGALQAGGLLSVLAAAYCGAAKQDTANSEKKRCLQSAA